MQGLSIIYRVQTSSAWGLRPILLGITVPQTAKHQSARNVHTIPILFGRPALPFGEKIFRQHGNPSGSKSADMDAHLHGNGKLANEQNSEFEISLR
jgi:hypothetical protein